MLGRRRRRNTGRESKRNTTQVWSAQWRPAAGFSIYRHGLSSLSFRVVCFQPHWRDIIRFTHTAHMYESYVRMKSARVPRPSARGIMSFYHLAKLCDYLSHRFLFCFRVMTNYDPALCLFDRHHCVLNSLLDATCVIRSPMIQSAKKEEACDESLDFNVLLLWDYQHIYYTTRRAISCCSWRNTS